MAAARELVQLVRCENFVLGAEFEELEGFFSTLTLKHIQILNYKLILLSPSDPQTLRIVVEPVGRGVSFAERGEASDATRIQ